MEKLDRTGLMDVQKAVMKHLERVTPYLDRYTDFAESNWTLNQVSQRSHWDYPHFIYETSEGFRWRKGILPTRLSRRLYFTGKENFPYLGLEGEIVSGWRAASAISKKLGRT